MGFAPSQALTMLLAASQHVDEERWVTDHTEAQDGLLDVHRLDTERPSTTRIHRTTTSSRHSHTTTTATTHHQHTSLRTQDTMVVTATIFHYNSLRTYTSHRTVLHRSMSESVVRIRASHNGTRRCMALATGMVLCAMVILNAIPSV